MKILHIIPSYKPAYIYGGPIESVSKLCEGLADAGHDVDVFTTTANGTTELAVKAGQMTNIDGVNVIYFKRVTKDPTHISPELWRHLYFNAKNYDVVHIQSWWNVLVIVAACICHFKKIKVVISPRGMLSEYIFNSGSSKAKKVIHSTIGRSALSKSQFHATAISEYEECRRVIPNWKGFIQPNLITLPKVPVLKSENAVFTLIFMSRIHPKKGLEILFHAISKLKFPVVLKVAGSGDEEYIHKLKELATELKITESIEWLGWVGHTDKFKVLMNSDLFVLISLNENFANVVIESLHMGTPVLLSGDVALAAFVRAQDMGWISSLDVIDVADKISTAKEDHNKLERINKNARAIVKQNFSEKELIQNYIKEYQKTVYMKA